MSAKKHLFIGFGDIARRCAEKLIDHGENVVGIARSDKTIPAGVEFWQGNITESGILQRMGQEIFSSVVITLTPDGRDAQAYRRAYLEPVQSLVKLWQEHNPPQRIIFVSSTRVYGQQADDWVDELSPTEPVDEQGELLVQTEQCLLQSSLAVCVLRFSGIYGPQRDFLIRQVQAGKMGDNHFTNRIHVEDCCGVILYLLRELSPQAFPKILLASDNSPVKSSMIRAWLAQQLDSAEKRDVEEVREVQELQKLQTVQKQNSEVESNAHAENINQTIKKPAKSRTGSKRCSNAKLLQLGYKLKYPTYQEGYQAILQNHS